MDVSARWNSLPGLYIRTGRIANKYLPQLYNGIRPREISVDDPHKPYRDPDLDQSRESRIKIQLKF